MKIKWILPKWLLYMLLFVILSLPLLAIFWFVAKFDLPFIHGGDGKMIYSIAFLYWLVCVFFIFGFKFVDSAKDRKNLL